MSTHLIQRQTVEVLMNGTEAQALQLQREVVALCENGLSAAIEQVFNLYDHDKSDIIIDYLTVAVHDLHTGNFSEAFLASVTTQLESVLQSRALLKRNNFPAPAHDGNLIVYKRDAQVEIESRVELVFFHFLRTGALLWWASPDHVKSCEAAVLNLLSASPATVQELRITLQRHAAARQRFLLQFPRSWQQQVLARLAPAPYARTLTVQHILQALSPPLFTEKEQQFYEWQLNSLLQPDIPVLQLARHALVQLGYSTAPAVLALTIADIQERLQAVETGASLLPGEAAGMVAAVLQEPLPQMVENNLPGPTPLTEGDYFYIHNAGLILLAPFIPQYLRYCNAADESGILREGYAAALLEYLATGRTGVGEHEMTFNKVLCGIPVEQPLEKITALSAAHTREAENLLSSVISGWPVLKNTSIDGLRASFLQRAGKLSVKDSDGNWLLQVERQSYDEWLLADLPWGYNITGIPYGKHKKLIWTEWI